jgi:hypothetical protein
LFFYLKNIIFALKVKQKDMGMIYSKELANRFVNDYRLPIQLTDEKYFFYYLDLYEKDFESRTKYNRLCQVITEHYDGSPNKFLDTYYKVRDNIIKTVENSDSYKRFNVMDMSRFSIKEKNNITTNNVYKETNVGRVFLSLDLKKANFQALKYVDPEIVLNANTYEEFIKKFTDLDYIVESKYSRQVIFGKLNPKRHITVEKYLINEIYKRFKNVLDVPYECVSISNDEIVFDLGILTDMRIDEIYISSDNANKFKDFIKNGMGIELNVEMYVLHKVQFCCDKFKRSSYYYKEYLNCDKPKGKLMCVPMNYFAIVYKLFNKLPLQEEDFHFDYEGLDCRYCENFYIDTDIK